MADSVEREIADITEQKIEAARAFVYRKDEQGRNTRMLLSMIGGLKGTSLGRSVITIFGLKKMLSKINDRDAMSESEIDLAISQKQWRDLVNGKNRNPQKENKVITTMNAAANALAYKELEQRQKAVAEAQEPEEPAPAYQQEEEAAVPAPDVEELDEDDVNVITGVNSEGQIVYRTFKGAADYTWTMAEFGEVLEGWASLSDQERETKYALPNISPEEFAELSSAEQDNLNIIANNNRANQILIANAETLHAVCKAAHVIHEENPEIPEPTNYPNLMNFLMDNLAAKQDIPKLAFFPQQLAEYLQQDASLQLQAAQKVTTENDQGAEAENSLAEEATIEAETDTAAAEILPIEPDTMWVTNVPSEEAQVEAAPVAMVTVEQAVTIKEKPRLLAQDIAGTLLTLTEEDITIAQRPKPVEDNGIYIESPKNNLIATPTASARIGETAVQTASANNAAGSIFMHNKEGIITTTTTMADQSTPTASTSFTPSPGHYAYTLHHKP